MSENEVRIPEGAREELAQFRLRDVPLDHPALQVTMPLVSVHGDEATFIGSSFLVAPGLAITAEHVVADQQPPIADSMMVIQLYQGTAYGWQVNGLTTSKAGDIAVLRFRRPVWSGDGEGQVRPPVARISFAPPLPGEEVRLFGFSNATVEDRKLILSPTESAAKGAVGPPPAGPSPRPRSATIAGTRAAPRWPASRSCGVIRPPAPGKGAAVALLRDTRRRGARHEYRADPGR
jgi:hypothetical protein